VREVESGCKVAVHVPLAETVQLIEPTHRNRRSSGQQRAFGFDRCYWSVDKQDAGYGTILRIYADCSY
jgi:hypothetical protein